MGATKNKVTSLVVEGTELQYVRDSFGKNSVVLAGTKGKSITLTGWRANAVTSFLAESPMPDDYGFVPDATSFTHEIKRKDATQKGWTWLVFNGKVNNEVSAKLKEMGYKFSFKRMAYYLQDEMTEKKVRAAIKL